MNFHRNYVAAITRVTRRWPDVYDLGNFVIKGGIRGGYRMVRSLMISRVGDPLFVSDHFHIIYFILMHLRAYIE